MSYSKETLSWVKENKTFFVLLLVIVLFGLYLRAYHVDYPVVGYHNWKETHYLTEARNFNQDGFFASGFFVPANDYPLLNSDPSGAHADTFPTISIFVTIFFKIFGEGLGAARAVGILFSIGTIFAMFLFTKRLFKRKDIALVAALLTAINPLFVFFSHNVQLMNPGVFFMILSAYFYLRWRESNKGKDLITTAIFLALAGLTKYPFLLIVIPMAITFPYSRLKTWNKEKIKSFLPSILILLSIPMWLFYARAVSARYGKTTFGIFDINSAPLITAQWWRTMYFYMADNYSILGVILAIIGLILVGLFYTKKEGKFGEKFVLSYALGTLIFIFIMAQKLGGHSYHQFPMAPLIIVLMSYTFLVGGSNLASMLLKDKEKRESLLVPTKYAVLILLVLILLLAPSLSAKNRQFDTQFVGLDVAGEYIKEHSSPEERMFFSGGQSFGVLWHADRKGYYPMPDTVEKIRQGEEQGVEWFFIYQWGFNILGNEQAMTYIRNNYELEQIGFIKVEGQDQLVYLLLKKGGTFDENNINQLIQNKLIHTVEYEFTQGTQQFYYINIED